MTREAATINETGDLTNDRDLDCAAYLQSGVDGLVANALKAGWTEDEISNALLSLVQDRVASERDDAFVDIGPEPGEYRH